MTTREQLLRLQNDGRIRGRGYDDIAAELGISKQRVAQLVKELKIDGVTKISHCSRSNWDMRARDIGFDDLEVALKDAATRVHGLSLLATRLDTTYSILRNWSNRLELHMFSKKDENGHWQWSPTMRIAQAERSRNWNAKRIALGIPKDSNQYRPSGSSSKCVCLRITTEQYNELTKLAIKRNITQTHLAHDIIVEYIVTK